MTGAVREQKAQDALKKMTDATEANPEVEMEIRVSIISPDLEAYYSSKHNSQ